MKLTDINTFSAKPKTQQFTVCLRRGHHIFYDDLYKYPPKGVSYILPKFVTSRYNNLVDNVFHKEAIKRDAFRILNRLMRAPHAVEIPTEPCDLIYSCGGIIPKNKSPWVIDLEHVTAFIGMEHSNIGPVKGKIEKYLSSEYCKKIMPYTQAAKQSILNCLNAEMFKSKIEVVYPAIVSTKTSRTKSDSIRLLFIGGKFYGKGGRETLEAFERLRKKYDVTLTFMSDTPKGFIKKYPMVDFRSPNIPHEEMGELYRNADIFVMPSYQDPLGMVFLEAMNFKLPIVTTDVFAMKEVTNNGKCGINVHSTLSVFDSRQQYMWKDCNAFWRYAEKNPQPGVASELVKVLSRLIESTSLRQRMGNEGKKQIQKGKFSIKVRNATLRKIFEEALKS